ncbi:hypothetical protein [Patulibacter sp.]|uniref:hypothetical protein n=1 Tax=Patulibacter sp. TaxID=1912859 RepID=UPI00272BB8D5|nr:hypothetical protein [Patulibacter sp.]
MRAEKMFTQKMHVHILLPMLSLSAPVGALGAARSFFTPPTVTPVNGPASWFAAQRTTTAATRSTRTVEAGPASGFAIEEFDLGGDADLDALEERDAAGTGRERR